ncbi:hypothetical protein sos41_29570 [Alphaproteobacteria bacterium SO-S41]|nr:hypothetical protein sos41_29570 [Alphaproteobacteria bacterium SO-S41]
MADDIEKLSRRRRVILALYGILFLGLQAVLFKKLDDPIELWRPIHYAYAASYLGWSGTLIYIFSTGGLLFRGRSPEARAALNDELTEANRVAGYKAGYWAVLIVAFVLFVLSQTYGVTAQEALRITFAVGVAMPACRFAGLERKQGA